MEKSITLASYNGAKLVKFGETTYPIEAVVGFGLDENGKISSIFLDTETYNAWLKRASSNNLENE